MKGQHEDRFAGTQFDRSSTKDIEINGEASHGNWSCYANKPASK
jgi:hypothetical protein